MAEESEADFVQFLSELENTNAEHMATAHHSAVGVREWAAEVRPQKSDG
ncbi:hypothetical protein [Streptomyces microflavus]